VGRKEDAQELAEKILNDESSWSSISEYKGDLSFFSEEVVRDALLERTQNTEEFIALAKFMMSNSDLGTCKELLDFLVESADIFGEWELAEAIVQYSTDDVLRGPIRNWFIQIITKEEGWVVDFYQTLVKHPILKQDTELFNTISSNIKALIAHLYDVEVFSEALKDIAEFTGVLQNDEVIEVIIGLLRSSDWMKEELEDIQKLYPFPEDTTFWERFFKYFEENEYSCWECFEALEINYLFGRNIDSQGAFKENIRKNGWVIAKAALMIEIMTAKTDYESENITLSDLHDKYSRFFEMFRVDGIVTEDISPKWVLEYIEWKGNFDELLKDVKERVLQLLHSHVHAGGTSHGVEISKLEGPEGIVITAEILESRKQEMSAITIRIFKGLCADLRPLWKTHYGREYLKAENIWRFCSIEKFREIEKDFEQLGYRFSIIDVSDQGPYLQYGFDSSFIQKIDAESSHRSIEKGLDALKKSKHPESIHVVRELIGREGRSLSFANQWPALIPLGGIVDLLQSVERNESRRILLDLLRGCSFASFETFPEGESYIVSVPHALIVKGFIDNHDESVIAPLLDILDGLKRELDHGSVPFDSEELVGYIVNILSTYQLRDLFYSLVGLKKAAKKLKENNPLLLQVIEDSLNKIQKSPKLEQTTLEKHFDSSNDNDDP
jgi:hypothetical protein